MITKLVSKNLTWLIVIGLTLTPGLASGEGSQVYLPLVTLQNQATVNSAESTSYPWQNHAVPFNFLFGNRMDQHQQSKSEGQDRLTGFLYVDFTGEYNQDDIPKAQHADCSNPINDCFVGWTIQGIQMSATLLEKGAGGPPQWCIAQESWPSQPGYTHFHWVRESSHDGSGEHSGIQVGETYNGYLIKLTARTTFVFQHSGQHGQGGEPGDPPTDPGGGHDGGTCDDGSHDDGGCSGDDGGCSGDDGGCSGNDGNCTPKGTLVTPGIDLLSHANVTTCQ